MKTEHYLTLFGIFLTLINIILTYFNLRFSRRKEFQDKLFQLKFEAYNELNNACYESVNRLDINSTPFVQIYDFKQKDEWVEYCENNMGNEYKQSHDIQRLMYKYSLILPSDIIEKYYEFTNACISFVTSCYHFDSELISNNQNQLANLYVDLINKFRTDLNIDLIDGSLSRRISSKF